MILPALFLFQAPGSATQTLHYQRGSLRIAAGDGPARPLADALAACDVTDTTIDQAEPLLNEGGLYTLSGGMGKATLIRFGQLQRYIGPNARIISAKLILTQTSPTTPQFKSAGILKRAWGEGPAYTLKLLTTTTSTQPIPLPVSKAGVFGATWDSAESGIKGAKWTVAGASDPADAAPIPVTGHPTGIGTFEIDGLGQEVQAWVSHPTDNHGLALRFANGCEFASSEDPGTGPELEIVYAPGTADADSGASLAISNFKGDDAAKQVSVTVSNLGSTASAPTSMSELADGLPQASVAIPAIAAHASVEVTATLPGTVAHDQRFGTVSFGIQGNEASSQFGAASYASGGIGLSVKDPGTDAGRADLIQAADASNLALNRSRFSFSPGGCLARIKLNFASDGIPLTATSRAAPNDQLSDTMRQLFMAMGATDFNQEQILDGPNETATQNGFFGGGTFWNGGLLGGTRLYDGGLPPSLVIPQQACVVPYMAAAPTQPTGPLGAVTVGQLNQLAADPGLKGDALNAATAGAFPRLILLRAYGGNESPLKATNLDFYRVVDGKVSPTSEFDLKTDSSGIANMKNIPVTSQGGVSNPFGTNRLAGDGSFAVKAQFGNSTAWALLTSASMLESAYRGNKGLAFADLHFALPLDPTDTSKDFADDSSSNQASGAAIAGPIELNDKNGWAEWDLRRDRALGEVDITFAAPPATSKIVIAAYGTGQTIKDAINWSTDIDPTWSYVNRGEKANRIVTVRYFGPSMTGRFIRVLLPDGGKATIQKISIYSPLMQSK